jgi:hypothetical protein
MGVASSRFSRQAHGADVREQGVVAAMNGAPSQSVTRQVLRNLRRTGMALARGLGGSRVDAPVMFSPRSEARRLRCQRAAYPNPLAHTKRSSGASLCNGRMVPISAIGIVDCAARQGKSAADWTYCVNAFSERLVHLSRLACQISRDLS